MRRFGYGHRPVRPATGTGASTPSNTSTPSPVLSLVTPDLMKQVRVTCLSNVHAVQFRDHLLRRGVVVDAVEDTDVVLAYLGDLDFIQKVTSEALLNNFADPAVMFALLEGEEADAAA